MPEGTDNIAGLNPTLPGDSAPAGEGAAEFRQLKAALVNCIGGMDGAVVNASGTKPTAAEWSKLFSDVARLIGGGDTGDGGGGTVGYFTGQINLYYGRVDAIPAGWVLCDGRNNTPNLIGKFALGWNDIAQFPTYNGASTGGAEPGSITTGPAGGHQHSVLINDHEITAANLPSHTHEMFSPASKVATDATVGANQTVAAEITGGADENQRYQMEASATPTVAPTVGRTGAGGLSDSPTVLKHTFAASNSIPDHTHTLDGASLPPWSCVFYIMYVG